MNPLWLTVHWLRVPRSTFDRPSERSPLNPPLILSAARPGGSRGEGDGEDATARGRSGRARSGQSRDTRRAEEAAAGAEDTNGARLVTLLCNMHLSVISVLVIDIAQSSLFGNAVL